MSTRGLANNNPGNLVKGGQLFLGEVHPSGDSRYRQFSDMVWGIRAMMRVLRTYINSHGLVTVPQIISRWAPASDGNDPKGYSNFVASRMGITTTTKLTAGMAHLHGLSDAIIRFETGQTIDGALIRQGYQLLDATSLKDLDALRSAENGKSAGFGSLLPTLGLFTILGIAIKRITRNKTSS